MAPYFSKGVWSHFAYMGDIMELPKKNLWQLLTSNERPIEIIEYPRYQNGKSIGNIALRTLTQEDILRIQEASIKEFNRRVKTKEIDVSPESVRGRQLQENIYALHYVFEATRDADNIKLPAFPTVEHLSKEVHPDELAVLTLNIARHQKELGPVINDMTEDEMNDWITKIQQAAERGGYFLDSVLSEVQTKLLMYTVAQLRKLQTDKSYVLSQLDKIEEEEKKNRETANLEKSNPTQ